MKPIFRVFALFFALHPAYAELEFSGYLRSADGVRFVITDGETRTASGWLAIGDEFRQHTLVGFDAKAEMLLLDRAGTTVRLPLRDSRVTDGKAELPRTSDVKITVGANGALLQNGRPLVLAEFENLLRQFAARRTAITVALHQPLDATPQSLAANEQLQRLIGKIAGEAKLRWRITYVDAPPPK